MVNGMEVDNGTVLDEMLLVSLLWFYYFGGFPSFSIVCTRQLGL